MPEYPYRCLACEHTFSDIVPMEQYKKRRKCPECKEHKLERVLGNVTSFVKGEAKTLEHLAARNTEKMGKYELQDKTREHGAKASGEAKERRELQKKINSMTPQQKVKWIHGGD